MTERRFCIAHLTGVTSVDRMSLGEPHHVLHILVDHDQITLDIFEG